MQVKYIKELEGWTGSAGLFILDDSLSKAKIAISEMRRASDVAYAVGNNRVGNRLYDAASAMEITLATFVSQANSLSAFIAKNRRG